jgi:hypothetical protein
MIKLFKRRMEHVGEMSVPHPVEHGVELPDIPF